MALVSNNPIAPIDPLNPTGNNYTVTPPAAGGLLTTSPSTSATGVSSIAPIAPLGSVHTDAVTRTVDPATQTVQGQVSNIIVNDSPMMQLAATRASQASNAKGLLNSSMAVGDAQKAVIDTATPIANADANIYNTTESHNMDAINASTAQRDQTQNNMAQFNAGQALDAAKVNLDSTTKVQLADIEANYKTLMQANASLGTVYQDMIKNISAITQSTTMDATAKQTATDQQVNSFKQYANMTASLNNLNISSLLDFGGTAASGSTTATTTNTQPTTLAAGTAGLPTTNLSNGMVVNVGGANYQLTGYSPPSYNLIGQATGSAGTWTKL